MPAGADSRGEPAGFPTPAPSAVDQLVVLVEQLWADTLDPGSDLREHVLAVLEHDLGVPPDPAAIARALDDRGRYGGWELAHLAELIGLLITSGGELPDAA